MGCFFSRADQYKETKDFRDGRVKSYRRPTWKADEPMTAAELKRKQDEFWDTQPHYGGSREIWDALKAACEADMETSKVIIQAAGVIVAAEDMSVCYDERGAKYELPNYVLAPPTNLSAPPTDSPAT